MKTVLSLAALSVMCNLTGCQGESSSEVSAPKEVIKDVPMQVIKKSVEYIPITTITTLAESIGVPMSIIEPSKPVMPIFSGDGIEVTTQRPFAGKVVRGGNVYLYEQNHVELMQDFELPKYKVGYKYKPYLEILIGDECIRYDFDTQLFGMAQAHCVFSNPKDGVSLEDIKSAYFNEEIGAVSVWVNGVVGLALSVS